MTNGIIKVDTATTAQAGYLAMIVGFITSVNWERWIYVIIAVATFFVQWYYRHQDNLRAQRAEQRAIATNSIVTSQPAQDET